MTNFVQMISILWLNIESKGSFFVFVITSLQSSINDYIVSQMSIRSWNQDNSIPNNQLPIDSGTSLDLTSKSKNSYIGLTLMEYFKLSSLKQGLAEIDQQSNSSVSAGTPCFQQFKDSMALPPKSKKHRRDKVRTQVDQQLLPVLDRIQQPSLPKVSTINLDQITHFDKAIVKLPSIHEHRHNNNNSRQGMLKQGKIFHSKKDPFKSRQDEVASLGKQSQVGRIHQLQRNGPIGKKSIRARVTSTSFYHNNGRQRERIKTQEELPDKILQKSFIVTRYGIGFPKRSRDQMPSVMRKQNSSKPHRSNF